MRIGIEVTNWANPRGYGRYARGLITAVLADRRGHEYVLIADKQTAERCAIPDNVEVIVAETTHAATDAASAGGSRSIRDLWAMRNAVSNTALDVLFYPSVFTYFPAKTNATKIVGIHDVIAERYPDLVFPNRKDRLLWNLKSWIARRDADYLLTVSDHARAGIVEMFGWSPEKVFVVGEAPDEVFHPINDKARISEALARNGLESVSQPDSRYVMFLGGHNPHKNLITLIDALADLRSDPNFGDVKLVLVGPAESDTFTPGTGNTRQRIRDRGLSDAVIVTGYIPDAEVALLMNGARALVLPSFDEGYGLPAVEAAACGTPVIATTSSPIPALLQGGGIFFDPRDGHGNVRALKDALAVMCGDDQAREQMADMALERASTLTWARAANEFHGMVEAIGDWRLAISS